MVGNVFPHCSQSNGPLSESSVGSSFDFSIVPRDGAEKSTYRKRIFLYPPLDVGEVDEESKIGTERVVVSFRLQRGRYPIARNHMQVDMSIWSATFSSQSRHSADLMEGSA
jgi:hypothetical protein